MVSINSSQPISSQKVFMRDSMESDHYGQCQMPVVILDQTRSPYLSYLLPIFADKDPINQKYYPLRANIPTHHLLPEEYIRRTSATSNTISTRIDTKWINSSNEIERRLAHYAQQWNLDPAIIQANLNRMVNIIPLLKLYSFFWRLQEDRGFEVATKEWYWVLEFYMQMDIDCFFMKTCSFYPISPRFNQEHIFAVQLPEARYGIQPCRDQDCRFCHERLDLTYRFEPAMTFSPKQVHCFVNGYQVYLNTDVTCQTSHVLYALTCPCHQYDYLGRCKQSFRDRMREHRMEACRQMRNFFLGQQVIEQLQQNEPTDPAILLSHKQLIDHSTHCTVALNMFLKCQPKYWCFVPMSCRDADLDDAEFQDPSNPIHMDLTLTDNLPIISPYQHSPDSIRWCMKNLPKPPTHYRFSQRQRMEQYDFFLNRYEMYPTRFLDMYNTKIVIALPNPCSDEIRHWIHALFIAFTQPKLNVMASSSGKPILLQTPCRPWCADLIHPRRSSFSTSSSSL